MMKKSLKRATVAVAALSLAVSGIPATAFSQNMAIVKASADDQIFESGDFRFKVTGKNTQVILLGFTESAAGKAILSIPSTVNFDDYDFPVTSIARGAFKNCTAITSIVFTDKDGNESKTTNLTSIEAETFKGCTGLKDITLAEGITTLGGRAFENCTNLATINLPSTISNVKGDFWWYGPFTGCTGLQKVTFAEGTTTIPNHIFTGLDFFTSSNFNIPATVTTIGEDAFGGLIKMDNIVLPEGLQSIGQNAFAGCSSLTSITLPKTITTLGSNSFRACNSLTEAILPKSLVKVDTNGMDEGPFEKCENLTNIVFEEGMETIPAYILSGANNVKEVSIPETVTAIGEGSFSQLVQLKTVTLPSKLESIGKGAFEGCSSLMTITFPETITTLGSCSFRACNRLTEITLPKTLTTVETNLGDDSPFAGCENLIKVEFEEGMETVPAYILKNASSVKEVSIPETVTAIGEGSFSQLAWLETIALPSKLESVGRGAFEGCSSLMTITFPETIITLGSCSFRACNRLTEITLPKTLTTVKTNLGDDSPFVGCENLKKVVFEEGATVVPAYILNHATYVEEVSIPNSVTKIGQEAFSGCTNLSPVSLPANLVTIGSNSFKGCNELTEVTLPKTLTTVEDNWADDSPFVGCENLTKVTFQDGMVTIPSYILNNVSNVKQVVIPSSVTEIQNNAFKNITKNITIYGYTNSYAETYAKENNISFVAIGVVPTVTETPAVTGTPVVPTGIPEVPTAPAVTGTPEVPTTPVIPTQNPITPTAPAVPTGTPDTTVKPTKVPVKAPKKVTISSVKRNSAQKATVKWKKVSGAAGYQVTYSTKSNFKGAKTKNVAKSKNSYTITGLKKGQVYYVKVRAYKKDSKGKKISGAYSTVKKIKKK